MRRTFIVPIDPDGPDVEASEGPDGDPLHAKVARTAPAAITDVSRMNFSPPASEGQEAIHPGQHV